MKYILIKFKSNTYGPFKANNLSVKNVFNIINIPLKGDYEIYKYLTYENKRLNKKKRIFDKYAGVPVHKYFVTLKMQEATRLLEQGETTDYIALKLGFSSQAYFSKAYKREMGIFSSEIKKKRM